MGRLGDGGEYEGIKRGYFKRGWKSEVDRWNEGLERRSMVRVRKDCVERTRRLE